MNCFYRFRYLQYQPSKGFGAITAPPEKPLRYAQPKDSGCRIYLPPLLPQEIKNWALVMQEPDIPICITEGELKAACGSANSGLPTLGLGGVYNWRSAKQNLPLIPDLEGFKWAGRTVYLCFDSDAATNPMVALAAAQLSRTLTDRGAKMYNVELPAAPDGSKQGLDDFAYAQGPEALVALLSTKAQKTTKEVSASLDLHRMNLEVALVANGSQIIQLHSGQVLSPREFTDVQYKDWKYTEQKAKGDGVTMVTKYTAKEWMEWPFRLKLKALAYHPGAERITEEAEYNTWHPYLVEPAKGSVTPWLELLSTLTGNAEPRHVEWLRQWFAYPLAHPGSKLYTAVIIWGRHTGTGKTLLGTTMRRIYGKNYRPITKTDLESQFNDWAAGHQFIVGDEISTGNKRSLTDSLKDIITREEAVVNVKYQKPYTVRDYNNYYFTSNHCDAFFIEDQDRRYFVHEAAAQAAPPEFYERYVRWLDQEGGAAALLHYFLHDVDLGAFDPKGRAPLTQSKLTMIQDGKSDLGEWVSRLKDTPDAVLRGSKGVLPYAFYTIQDLMKLCVGNDEGKKRIETSWLSRELRTAGFHQVASGSNNCMVDGARTKLWIVRDCDRLRIIGPAAASKMYAEERIGHGPKFTAEGKRMAQ